MVLSSVFYQSISQRKGGKIFIGYLIGEIGIINMYYFCYCVVGQLDEGHNLKIMLKKVGILTHQYEYWFQPTS